MDCIVTVYLLNKERREYITEVLIRGAKNNTAAEIEAIQYVKQRQYFRLSDIEKTKLIAKFKRTY